ncbi:hypothetical protein [Larkinella rosea]|uniref:Alpha-L-rhamnosidase six-hairpin glycosidase domain-containing protein n=1 Tax=Larkinella rosea TaxID=2025312 RepID=A0A3P1BNC1_9BACT|nr:hypothetical protein [Larkinella rosea]RRB02569.1 hypothetical protein EHT25_19145 [Larkinella rosea]
MKKILKAIALIAFAIPVAAQQRNATHIQKVIASADVIRSAYTDEPVINLYQGNGLFGCSYGLLGLHIHPAKASTHHKFGNTRFMHLEHRGRGKFGGDYLLPLAQLYWADAFQTVSEFSQHQAFYEGTITTRFRASNRTIAVKTWFDPVDRNLSGIAIQLKGEPIRVILDPASDVKGHYDQRISQVSKISAVKDQWKIELTGLGTTTPLYLKTNAVVTLEGNVLQLTLKEGENRIQLSVKKPVAATTAQSLRQTIHWWDQTWQKSGLIEFPEATAQKMWVRSMAQFLYSYGTDQKGIPPPMGFTGNGWPFNFPQDASYVLPVLLATGQTAIGKSWIEYFSARLQGMKQYTQRHFHRDGVMVPWVFPYGSFDGYHDPAPPNIWYYEIHNSGYLARMAVETAVFVNDTQWTQKYVLPLLKETAAFYGSICTKETDGFWHLSLKPSMGQDEFGGVDQKDYLCALYSAQYCFQQAIAYGLDNDHRYSTILKDGLAFQSLKAKGGFYYTSSNSPADFGKQKHPVQLNELAYLPVHSSPSEAASLAYQRRYELLADASKPYFHGWSLGEILLAGSRLSQPQEWLKDWHNLVTSNNIDPEWIQVFETSKSWSGAFYNSTNGLIVQSLVNNVLTDWYGKMEIATCFPWKGKVVVRNLYSRLGVKVTGSVSKTAAQLELRAWKNCEFWVKDRKVKLKRNERITLSY